MKNINSLKNYRDFGKVYNHRKSFADKYLVMYVADNLTACSRIGISVSKKVGNSVVRHRTVRLIREVCRLHEEEFAGGYDIVFVARVRAKGISYFRMEHALMQLAAKAGILKEK